MQERGLPCLHQLLDEGREDGDHGDARREDQDRLRGTGPRDHDEAGDTPGDSGRLHLLQVCGQELSGRDRWKDQSLWY